MQRSSASPPSLHTHRLGQLPVPARPPSSESLVREPGGPALVRLGAGAAVVCRAPAATDRASPHCGLALGIGRPRRGTCAFDSWATRHHAAQQPRSTGPRVPVPTAPPHTRARSLPTINARSNPLIFRHSHSVTGASTLRASTIISCTSVGTERTEKTWLTRMADTPSRRASAAWVFSSRRSITARQSSARDSTHPGFRPRLSPWREAGRGGDFCPALNSARRCQTRGAAPPSWVRARTSAWCHPPPGTNPAGSGAKAPAGSACSRFDRLVGTWGSVLMPLSDNPGHRAVDAGQLLDGAAPRATEVLYNVDR